MSPRSLRALAGMVLVASACTQAPSGTTVPTGDGSSTSSPETVTSTGLPAPAIEWVRIDGAAMFAGGFLNAVVERGGSLVAVGTDELPEDAAVWVSTDAVTWERVESASFAGEPDDDGVDGSQRMADVVAADTGFVAVGGAERQSDRDVDAAVWLSPDGLVWERADAEALAGDGYQEMSTIAAWGGDLYAAGEAEDPATGVFHPAVWRSSDGFEWVPVESGAFDRFEGTISQLEASGARLLAVGTTGHVARPTLWFSDDGATWDVVLSSDSGDSVVGSIDIGDTGSQTDLFMTGIAATADGYVAIGGSGQPTQGVFWQSADGLFWNLVGRVTDADRPTIPLLLEAVTSTPGGLVAVGAAPFSGFAPPLSFAEAWTSTDGSAWQQVPRTSSSTATEGPGAPWHIGSLTDVIPYDGGVLAVGFMPYQSLPGPFYRQAVWLGEWR